MQSIETSKCDDFPKASTPPATPAKTDSRLMICFAVLNFLGFIGIITGYFVFLTLAENSLESATEICDMDADGITIMEDVPKQTIESWAFNITNPYEYLNGANAEVNEVGVYAWEFQPELENIKVSNDIMEFDLYNNNVQFVKHKSCDTCETDNVVFSQFTPYSAIIGLAKSEAVVMLSMTCSPQQIGLIQNAAFPFCETSEMRTATMCRCCAGAPTVNATTCSDIAATTSRAGGLLSWISKYEGGIQLSSTPNANFPLSTGDYSALVRESNAKELALGSSSPIVGFFKIGQALQNGDTAAVSEFAKITNDMKDACSPLGYCPTMMDLLSQMTTPQSAIPILRSIDCSGIIPSAAVLEADYGMDHARAQELRYLEGTNCRPYGLTLAISTLIKAQQAAGGSGTCADSNHELPCCMSSFSAPAFGTQPGSAIGCLGWSNGFVQTRNLYSVEEANQYIEVAPHAQSVTGCAPDESMRYRQEMWHGRSEWNSWFTPTGYVYPQMNWADPSIVTGAMAGTTSGTYTEYDITGTQMGLRAGRGITTGFLEYDLTDGKPINDKEEIWAPFRLSSMKFKHAQSFEYQKLQVAKFKPEIQTEFTDAEIESRQRDGEMPYPNQKNLAYARGVPVVLGYPNFYKVNEAILSQSSNAARAAPNGAEIQLYRTRDGYGADAPLLATPARITTATLEEYSDDYEGDVIVEPATGVALDASIVTMISNFVWQCDPRLDSTCQLLASALNSSDPLCYNFGLGKQMPCSAANVFTPKVHGGKVMPLFWLRSLAVTSEDLVDRLLAVSDTRYALSVLVIILPFIFVIGFLYAASQIMKVESEKNDKLAMHRLNSL